ncbi:MAG: zinc finger Ran-binding domain-containing protein [Candidatus Eremiobacteraeota bacterium]|nr:zinc finger Ran-binding domain-containing protein [Candidatus Eremiobacteraeota bacterium]
MLCTECGYLNYPDARECEKCKRSLPDRYAPPPRLEKTHYELESACEKIRNREMSSGDFRDHLIKLENHFRKTLDDINKMDIPSDMMDEVKPELNTGTAGIKLYLEALIELTLYLDTKQEIYMERGLGMARDANNRLNEALKMNFESYRAIQETTEEFLSTQSGI